MSDIACLDSLETIDAHAWDRLTGASNPFVEHGFLCGLETSGSVGSPDRGWVPRHLVVHHQGRLVGAMPLYEKYDSYGEFIFDWAWADAAMRAGLPYYPKMVAAVPYTPATGPRLLLAADAPPNTASLMVQAARALAVDRQTSGLHVLFCNPEELPLFSQEGMSTRSSYQFHWLRAPGWVTFDDYLASLRAPSRKQVRRERQIARSHGLRLAMRRGTEMGDVEWDALYHFYRQTSVEKGAIAYLSHDFFRHMRCALPERVLAAMAYNAAEPVAGALYLTRGAHLYGRYWGCTKHYDALHFELCYYAPIEWGLQNGINRFEAGAQGEHKLKRGLLPRACHSAHWLAHANFYSAVQEFLSRESRLVESEMLELQTHSPYRSA